MSNPSGVGLNSPEAAVSVLRRIMKAGSGLQLAAYNSIMIQYSGDIRILSNAGGKMAEKPAGPRKTCLQPTAAAQWTSWRFARSAARISLFDAGWSSSGSRTNRDLIYMITEKHVRSDW